jgi:CRISPR-associated endonuclease/helicase Cas3
VRPEADGAGRLETPADLTASAACAAWIADDRRKAFLADVGVGTVDQALLGVLPTRFQSLRLWGLSDRVLIIDEAHSFDSYLSRELETLLEFHAALGGSAIVLSATLNATARNRIVHAFEKGLGCKVDTPSTSDAYPLLTLVGRGPARQLQVASRPESVRELRVRRIAKADDAIEHVATMSKRGACVAWIRNTVDDAIAAFEAVQAQGCDPILLHARFAMGDRLRTEADVQRLLGKSSIADQRRSRVLIGTQILEQSLDYDVDAMITDLAPVDMIIQRAGRLWRHPWRTGRPIGEGERELLLLSPDPDGEITPTWYKDQSKGAAAVYSDHGYVWRSAKVLIGDGGTGAIRTPYGIRGLLSAVYDEEHAPVVPDGLERASLDADGKRKASRSLAAGNSLDVHLGYLGNNLAWQSDTVTPTRLGEPVTVFRLARRDEGRIVPWHPLDDSGNSIARAWALSECAVRTRMAASVPEPAGALAREIADAKAAWPAWEQEQPLLLLEPAAGDIWRGRVVTEDKEREVLYDRMIGWRLASA